MSEERGPYNAGEPPAFLRRQCAIGTRDLHHRRAMDDGSVIPQGPGMWVPDELAPPGLDFPAGPFSLIYADPGWQYRDALNQGKRGVAHKYTTMDHRDIARLPVRDIAAPNCFLAMWWTPALVREALFVVEAWGFELITMKGFTWEKLTRNGGTFTGLGHWTRGNTEDCLFARRGKVGPSEWRKDKGVSQLRREERGKHSEKPAGFRTDLERLLGDVPRIELFSRHAVPGWSSWGDRRGIDE